MKCLKLSVFVGMTMAFTAAMGSTYSGSKMLEILGEDKNGDAVRRFRNEYTLDKALKNPDAGIKLTASHDSASVVMSVMVTSAGYEINDIKYKQFAAALPFDISFSDDEQVLALRLGTPKGSADDNKMRFKKDGITINVYFKNSSKKKIAYIKFSQVIGMVGPYRIDGNHDPLRQMVVQSEPEPVRSGSSAPTASSHTPSKYETASANASASFNMTSLPAAAEFGKSAPAPTPARSSKSQFYNAVMNVIESGEEEMFKDIKQTNLNKNNFWNYKYTYATNVSIPGEKYNMLYSFPFPSSQLDFVAVMEETDGSNQPIQTKYAEIEQKLKEDFKPSEGWSYHYTVNEEDPKGPKDFEIKNPKLGSIVLDYSVNPSGKHVLYLRFLLQYS